MKKIKNLLTIAGAVFAVLAVGSIANAEMGYVWLEAENGAATGDYMVVDNQQASGGMGMRLFTMEDGDSKIEFTFDIAETGSYDFKILSTAGNVMHLSRYRYLIDDGDYTYCNNSSIGDKVYDQSTTVGGIPVSWYPMTTQTLNAGRHTLTIRTNEAREIDEMLMIHYFDAVAVVPTDWGWTPDGVSRPVLSKKAEYNSAWYNFAESTNLKQPGVGIDGKGIGVIAEQPAGTKYSFPVKFKAPKAGTYDIYFCGAPAGVDYASDYCGYLVDGDEKGKVADSPYYKNIGGADPTGGGCGMAWQRVDRLELDTNEHEITFEIDSPRTMTNKEYVIGLRYLVIVPSDIKYDFSSCENGAQIAAEFIKNAITINDDLENVIDDLILHKNGVNGSKIKWTSSNPEVVKEDGTVIRPSFYGEDAQVTLTASVEVSDRNTTETVVKEFTMTVKKKAEYTVKNFQLTYPDGKYFGQNSDGGTLGARVEVSNNQNEEKDAILMLVMYDENGAMTALESKLFHLTDSLQELTLDMEITEEKEGYSVDAFLWTDMNTKRLIQDSVLTYKK